MGRSADMPRVTGGVVVTAGDDAGCSILHVDMDAFFASVEVRRRPELRGQPVIVGGGPRGVVAAASYEARRFGVRSAMPASQALRLCPQAVVIRPDHGEYAAVSREVMAILREITPQIEPLSLDEAFLDVGAARRRLGGATQIAALIKQRIVDELALTCSVGVAPSKFVAKLASSRCKPDGLLLVPADGVLAFLHPLPVTVLWGVGARTAEPLHRLGIRTVGDLAAMPPDTVRRAVGNSAAEHLLALARGHDPRLVHDRDPEKSISADRTSETDLTEELDVLRELLRLAEEVSSRVRSRGLVARVVGIKVRFADFRTVTRVRTIPSWVDTTGAIYAAAAELYRGLQLDRPRVRLLGVKCENLRPVDDAPQQLTFDHIEPDEPARRPALDRARDAAQQRFGEAIVRPATLVERFR